MSEDLLLGRQLGNFRIERLIGRGGMAQVYYGQDVKLNRPVALKVIDTRYRADPDYVKRFVREARAVALWRHENIVQIYHADDENGLYYFAMEYIAGLDLGALLASYTAAGELIPHADVVRIGRAVAKALDYAHQKGVVHRDVKPANVMVEREGRVALADFGLALEIQNETRGEVFGTARYIAPEQARRSAEAVPQSDLYSLGVILYEMLTGAPPFDDPSHTAVALMHVTEAPPSPRELNPRLNIETEVVLLKALSKAPADRYQTGQELMEALEAALQLSAASVTGPVELPPLPAGLQGPMTRSLSQMSVAEKVSLRLAVTPAASGARAEMATAKAGAAAWRPRIAGGMAVVAILVLSAWWLINSGAPNSATATPPPPSATSVAVVSPTTTPHPTNTSPPTLTPTTAPSDTPASTSTRAPSVTPTVLFPEGNEVLLFYNQYGFYMYNAGNQRVPLEKVAFEELVADSSLPTGHRFNALRWFPLSAFLERRRCAFVEDIRHRPSPLRPVQCENRLNVFLTLDVANSQYTFWLPREGVVWFRVLLDEEEIARCEIARPSCEVRFP